MNILFTSSTPFHPLRGGVGRVTDTLCKELQKRGYQVFYLNADWGDADQKNMITQLQLLFCLLKMLMKFKVFNYIGNI